jgi:hypothetical protein
MAGATRLHTVFAVSRKSARQKLQTHCARRSTPCGRYKFGHSTTLQFNFASAQDTTFFHKLPHGAVRAVSGNRMRHSRTNFGKKGEGKGGGALREIQAAPRPLGRKTLLSKHDISPSSTHANVSSQFVELSDREIDGSQVPPIKFVVQLLVSRKVSANFRSKRHDATRQQRAWWPTHPRLTDLRCRKFRP